MSVTSVIERWQGRGATTDEDGVRTLKREWTVETDSDLTGEPAVIDAVIAADATANLYAGHPDWAWALCRKLDCSPNGGPRVWLVHADYSTAPFTASGDGSGGGNPTSPSAATSNSAQADSRPPKITVGRKEVSKVLETDAVTGDPITNLVGDKFDPPPEVFRSNHTITFKFFRLPANLNWSTRSLFMDSINDAAFTVFGRAYPTHSLRCTEYSVDTVWETGASGLTLFFELTVQAEYNPDLWQPKILQTGRRRWVGGSIGDPDNPRRLVAIVDDAGQPVADPVPLNADGEPWVPGDDFEYAEPAGYVPRSWSTILA